MLTITLNMMMSLLRAEQAVAADQTNLAANVDPHQLVLWINASKAAHLNLAIENIRADPAECYLPTLLRCSHRLA